MPTMKKAIVFYPEELLQAMEPGPLYGRYFEESGIFNVVTSAVAASDPTVYTQIGTLFPAQGDVPQDYAKLVGLWRNGGPYFQHRGEPYETRYYSLHNDLFSRNTGILESRILLEKHAVILGCGSVGSLVALALARSGVGRFTLIDNDIFEYHNIARHQCSIRDVGAYKVHALAGRIREINPGAQIAVYADIIESLPKEAFDQVSADDTILIGCADNHLADVYANSIAALYKAPFLAIGCWHRAFAGAVFYWLPGMPCYYCALGDGGGLGALDARSDVSRRFYMDEEEAGVAALQFEPGLSVDIDFVTMVGIKLTLDLLCRDMDSYTPRLLGHLRQYTLICNTNRKELGGDMAEIFSYPLQVTTSLKTSFRSPCPPCKYE